MSAIITVENLSKAYRIGQKEAIPDTLVGALANIAKAPWRNLRRLHRLNTSSLTTTNQQPSPPTPISDLRSPISAPPAPNSDILWALRDVSFEVQAGEVLGIIGRNGAGKSTLLKLLSRITEPTAGRAVIRGRVSSLLEVGTGFHPELTGRENVYMNGTILGMTKREIDRKYDEIVEFSGVERFLDTPIKRYSSGMSVRLAFAVAAHLEPEILIIDEVLAVGDVEFQKKCLGKMQDIAHGGRTVLFVSHNMDAVRRLCTRAMLLKGGDTEFLGSVEETVTRYLVYEVSSTGRLALTPPRPLPNGMPLLLMAVEVAGNNGAAKQRFSAREPITVRMEWELTSRLYKPRVGFVLRTADGSEVLTALDAQSWNTGWLAPGHYRSECVIPGQLLNEGRYILDFSGDAPRRVSGEAATAFPFILGLTGGLLQFQVEDDMTLPNKYYGEEGFRDARWPGLLLLNIGWTQRALNVDHA